MICICLFSMTNRCPISDRLTLGWALVHRRTPTCTSFKDNLVTYTPEVQTFSGGPCRQVWKSLHTDWVDSHMDTCRFKTLTKDSFLELFSPNARLVITDIMITVFHKNGNLLGWVSSAYYQEILLWKWKVFRTLPKRLFWHFAQTLDAVVQASGFITWSGHL